MIEKKRPRKLNSSKDSRVRGADEMYDALNINVSADYDSTDAGGNMGVIKPSEGNTVLGNFEGIPTDNPPAVRVLGSTLDDENNVLYYFVWCSKAELQGVYAYDPDGFFPGSSNQIKAVFRSSLMKFPSNGFVKGDVVVLPSSKTISGQVVDPVLYFTDGVNEPRKIHVREAYVNLRTSSFAADGGIGVTTPSNWPARPDFYDVQDFMHACPKTPVHPITAAFVNDPDTRSSNFEGISGMQFAYQYIYDTGEESALSTYSDIVVPPAYVQQGAKSSADLSTSNICVLNIPTNKQIDPSVLSSTSDSPSDVYVRYLPRNVSKIRILMREGNRGAFSIVDTISAGDSPGVVMKSDPIIYEFRNDKVKKGFSKDEAQKPFDAVPLVAGAQTSASNRMMYADYTSGYDNVDVEATATVKYGPRLDDFKSLDVRVESTIDLLNQGETINSRRASIYFDVDGFPANSVGLDKDSTIDLTLTVRPKRNWHIYNSYRSFHGSRHLGNLSADIIDPHPTNDNTTIQPYQVSPNLASDGIFGVSGVFGEPGDGGSSRSRINDHSNLGLNSMWGANNGVTLAGRPTWRTVDSQHDVDLDGNSISPSPLAGASVPGVYGTSPANPFILRGRPLLFSVSIRIKENLFGPSYKNRLRDFIQRALTWDQDAVLQKDQFTGPFYNDLGESQFLEVLNLKSSFEYSIDEGLDGGDATTTNEEALSGAHIINVSNAGDDRKHLIVSVGNGLVVNPDANFSDLRNLSPCGYFIVNRARPKFSLRSRNDISNAAHFGVLHLNLDSLTDVETLTCMPFVDAELWIDKAMEVNPENGGNRGPEDTAYWAHQSLGSFNKEENWGLKDATAWQFETMVIDKWYCYSKEFMVRNTVPESLFTSLYSDYVRYLNGPLQVTADQISIYDPDGDLGYSVGQIIPGFEVGGTLNPQVSNNGALKNAAVLKQAHVKKLLIDNGPGVGGESDGKVYHLHFRHNMRLRVGGDGFLPAINGNFFSNHNGGDNYDKGRARILGWLDSGDSWLGDIDGGIYNTGVSSDTLDSWEQGFTLLDGAGGIGSKPGGGEAKLRYDKGLSQTMGTVNGMMLFCGYIGPRATVLPSKIKDGSRPPVDLDVANNIYSDRFDPYFNKFGQDCMMPFLGQFNYITLSPAKGYMWREGVWPALSGVGATYYATPMDLEISEGGQNVIPNSPSHDWRVDFQEALDPVLPAPALLDVGGGTLLAEEIRSGGRSFKSGANHSFGIVFYDERGRAGRVNPIQTTEPIYVENYEERDEKGRCSIELSLAGVPPTWAKQYQIVYAGNSSKSNFVQYSTGGAFVAVGEEESADSESQNIYVSLNYLQGNKDVSYAEAFGAVTPNGAKQLYTYSPGDKLKVISYFSGPPLDDDGDINVDSRVWVDSVEFDIVGVEDLSRNPEINPLRRAFSDNKDSVEMADAKSGQFLVLKNNPLANGFSYNDVKSGENKPTTNSHKWNNICVVEIYSPTKESSEEEDKLYYETGRVYDVGEESAGDDVVQYKTNPVLLERGDVWFRRVPLATPNFIDDPDREEFNKFENLVTYDKDNEVGSSPNFQNYYLEAKAFNDTFPGNDSTSRGKPNIIDDEFRQTRDKSSITYSDKHVFSKSKNRFSSFNSLKGNFKDLSGEYGKIDYLVNNYDSIVVIQENKSSKVPVERSVLSTADGSNSLVQSKEVLGIQTYYSGDFGSDGNPESVLKQGGYIFFASKTNAEVYRLSPGGGIEVISSVGMKAAFYNAFNDIQNMSNAYIPTGYNPMDDEFLISIKSLSPAQTQGETVLDYVYTGLTEADTGQDTVIPSDAQDTTLGCLDGSAPNYSPAAFEDDGSCIYFGCTTPGAINYLEPTGAGQYLPCDSGPQTFVDLVGYDNPDDCQCRFFNPCIIDAFSSIPDGKANYADLVDFQDFIGSGAALRVPGSFSGDGVNGDPLFESGVIKALGLDFTWVPDADLPPTSFNNNKAWGFVEDTWTVDCFNYFAAAYTEGPPFRYGELVEHPVGSFENARTEIDILVGDVEDLNGTYGIPDEQEKFWKADVVGQNLPWWTLAAKNQSPSLYYRQAPIQVQQALTYGSYNASRDVCFAKACADPEALNYKALANDCRDSGDAASARDITGPDAVIDFGDCNNQPYVYNICMNPNNLTYGETTIAVTPLSIGEHIASPTTSYFNDIELVTSSGGIDYIKIINDHVGVAEKIANRTQTFELPCPGSSSTFYGFYPSVSNDCYGDFEGEGEDGGAVVVGEDSFTEFTSSQVAGYKYYYYDACCQYGCDGTYYLDDNNQPGNWSDWTGDFQIVPQGSGIPECRQRLYDSSFEGDPNPLHDYNENVSGKQPEE